MDNYAPYQVVKIVNTGKEIRVVSDGTVVNLPAGNEIVYLNNDGTTVPQGPSIIDIADSPETVNIKQEIVEESTVTSTPQVEEENFTCWRHMYAKLYFDHVLPLRIQLASRKDTDEAKAAIYERTKRKFPDIPDDPFKWLNTRTEYLKFFNHRLKEWRPYDYLIMDHCVDKNIRLSGNFWPKTSAGASVPKRKARQSLGRPKKRKLDDAGNSVDTPNDELILKQLQEILSSLPENTSELLDVDDGTFLLPNEEENNDQIPKNATPIAPAKLLVNQSTSS
uniref:Uncharacterized protein n=1 Tax=Panagrolaimus sp. JU765 TaxID=591449 RepID=A0AC34QDN7_9BILA